MRSRNFSLMAVFMLGVQGQKEDLSSNNGLQVTFSPISQTSTGQSTPYVFTIHQAMETTVRLWLIQTVEDKKLGEGQSNASQIAEYCLDGPVSCPPDSQSTAKEKPTSGNFTIATDNRVLQPQGYFFLCFTGNSNICGPSSPPFNVDPIATLPIQGLDANVYPPNTNLSSRPEIAGVLPGIPSSLQSSATTISTTRTPPASSSLATVTLSPSSTVTITPSPDNTESAVSKGKAGLATGAKAGIAVGAVVLVLGLLLLAFFFRKKHSQRSSQERLMLSQSLNADSRDLITEKEMSAASYERPSPSSAFGTAAIPPGPPNSQTRHSALAPYEAIPAQPYSGQAASIPRRKPTINTPAAATGGAAIGGEMAGASATPISREVSSAASIGHSPPSQPESTTRGRDYEQYHDVPMYSDTRNAPKTFQGALQAPNGERGGSVALSEADQERLVEEEEERRIDAAIAEAERAKGTPR